MPQTPPPNGVQTPPQRRNFLDLRGMRWWEIVLVVLPLSLFAVGGLIGGVFGALAAVANVYVARSRMSAATRVLVMIGLLVAGYVMWFVVALVITLTLRSATG
jgi:hypothetical protein